LLATLVPLIRCSAYRQTADQVFVREPGERLLSGPHPVAEEAEKDWQFAMLSDAAYGRIPVQGQTPPVPTPVSVTVPVASPDVAQSTITCGSPDDALMAAGWTPWYGFPGNELAQQFLITNLRVEVWAKQNPPSVAVAFGGTNFKSGKDWISNLRWFIPFHHDEYTDLVSKFGPAFVAEFVRRANESGGDYLKNATIFSTGHSLGGGLAQQFAYALPLMDDQRRVKQVYAFDPSPVTGFYSVGKDIRDRNKKGLSIDRIYERGEILAIVRSFTSAMSPPSAEDPTIRAVRYSLFYPSTPLMGHSISELACKLKAAAEHTGGSEGIDSRRTPASPPHDVRASDKEG
jgi:Lipase (class 3)